MGLQDIATHGPFTTEMKFRMVNEKGDVAEALFDCPAGMIPPPEGVAILAEKAIAAIREAMPTNTWRFQTREEFVQDILHQQSGAPDSVKFAVPKGLFEAEWAQSVEA